MDWLIAIAGAGVGAAILMCGIIIGTIFGISTTAKTYRGVIDTEGSE